jgi:RNA recognition motif-containing protein
MEVENSTEKIERPGKEDINVKFADNTDKKAETAKKTTGPRRRFRRFKNSLGRRNYTGKRNISSNRRTGNYSKDNRRQRGLRYRRRGIKILVRNLTRNATNSDIKYLFEKIGPLKRCGINWNNLGESKGTAEVEYLYRKDAFKACKELDYKSIKGVPIRLEIRDGPKRILLNRRNRDNNRNRSSNRRFRSRSREYHRNSSDSRRRFSSRRISNRRGSRRRDSNSRSDRRYKKY